jgi:hypothetical protein
MKQFVLEWHPRADWFLQARIQQDKFGNITLDQSRYSKAIVERYLPNANPSPTQADIKKYTYPLPRGFKWTRDDNASSPTETMQLEIEFCFCFIEVVSSLNFLANTAIRQLFAIQRACRYTRGQPG